MWDVHISQSIGGNIYIYMHTFFFQCSLASSEESPMTSLLLDLRTTEANQLKHAIKEVRRCTLKTILVSMLRMK